MRKMQLLRFSVQLGTRESKIGHKVLTFKLPFCQGHLAPFPRETALIAFLNDVT